jgi:hypothetical protein
MLLQPSYDNASCWVLVVLLRYRSSSFLIIIKTGIRPCFSSSTLMTHKALLPIPYVCICSTHHT